MLNYYLRLALRSLKRNIVLTVLMVAAIGVGISAAMTIYTVLRVMSGDPIPDKSSKLFVPTIDNWGPSGFVAGSRAVVDQSSYRDVAAWSQAHRAARQVATYSVAFSVMPADSSRPPFTANARAADSDFFPMFEVPFRAGHAWGKQEDDDRANVVVISSKLADKLFGQENPIGRSINMDLHEYRVVGVIGDWDPQPHFYDVTGGPYTRLEDVFVPFTTAIAREQPTNGNTNCDKPSEAGWQGRLNSECQWISYWAELPTASAVRDFKQYLANYAVEQRRSGRFTWDAATDLYDVREWMASEGVVPNEMRISGMVASGFLLVCLVNSVGLMLAKLSGRSSELGVRRALGASKVDIFLQCVVESAVVGLVGGLLGLLLTIAGLSLERTILNSATAHLAHLDLGAVVITIALSVLVTICSGLYPSWRASRVQPAWQLKAQ
jgi:putative ABC transport system permease protein